jgi:plasmid stabilization system protein ParE
MMRVVFREKALKELREIMMAFRLRRDGSDLRFEEALDRELRYLINTPNGYQLREPPFRFAMLDDFKYFLIYAVKNDAVVIHRIRHMHRRPLKRYFGR